MNAILLLIIVGLTLYFLLSKKGGMGCCDGHHESRPVEKSKRNSDEDFAQQAGGETIIDLKADEYKVISIENESN